MVKSAPFKNLLKISLFIWLTTLLSGCQPVKSRMEPVIVYTPPSTAVTELPSAFPPLTEEEYAQDWGKELLIADAFAKELDLYRAITSYKRCLILLPVNQVMRRLQVEYDLMLSYYLGQKYQEVICLFEASPLTEANPLFPPFNNLLLILYESYLKLGQTDKAENVLETIRKCSPDTAEDLGLYTAFKEGNLNGVHMAIQEHRDKEEIESELTLYYQFEKSPNKARALNALLPGAGYYYIGQKRSAMTAFLINTLFTAAAYHFFHQGNWGAGAITASLEVGWYLGGINGAGLEAQEFNTHLYEGIGKKIMSEKGVFPVLMFETNF